MPEMVSFVCNICGQSNTIAVLKPEESSCSGCGSNIRIRALVYMLSNELFNDGLLVPEFAPLPGVKGLGLSDQTSYAIPLAGKFSYTNTFYDREPRLDITESNTDRYGTYDFILSSDVFEHVVAPIERAFDEACKLLKPHGVLCMTVPFSLEDISIERFPELHDFALVSLSGAVVLINRTADGRLQIRDDLVFHGGVGQTLEMRLFSQKDLVSKLHCAGFRQVRFQSEAVPEFGIAFGGNWSLPLVARKEEFVFDRRTVGQLAREYSSRTRELGEIQERHQKAVARLEECALQSARVEAECGRHIERLEAELAARGVWAKGLDEELQQANRNLACLESEFKERTRWALEMNDQLETERLAGGLRAQLDAVAQSRWVKLGNRLGLGPKLKRPADA
ncbi:MAG: methyltransferase domain-containing protein [Bryobacteraceae bacterium]